jgi:hypothetical protein
MATSPSTQTNQTKGTMGQQGQMGIDNLTYDLVTVLHEKAKGLEAYDRYLADAQSNNEVRQLLEQIRQSDLKQVEQLRGCLSKLLAGGGRTQNVQGS